MQAQAVAVLIAAASLVLSGCPARPDLAAYQYCTAGSGGSMHCGADAVGVDLTVTDTAADAPGIADAAEHVDIVADASADVPLVDDAADVPNDATSGCAPADCDDGDPCTQDSCAAGVCSHVGAPDASPCGMGLVCAKGACKDATLVAIVIPAGMFYMGCNAALDAACQADEKPQHPVTLAAFSIDLTEVTVARYSACVTAGACQPAKDGSGSGCNGDKPAKAAHPMNCVSFEEAAAFCAWSTPGGRLPTEAEWEKAARGGCATLGAKDCATNTRTFPWGELAPSCDLANWGNGCGSNGTWPAGSKPAGASPYGLRDMAGNVAEWVSDFYAPDFYGQSAASDPKGPAAGTFRVLRGGSLFGKAAELRAGDRSGLMNPFDPREIGFRCAAGM